MIKYNVGDTIEYRAFGGETRTVEVQGKEDDIKNGRPGFDGVCINPNPGQPVWGYDDQITRVVKRV